MKKKELYEAPEVETYDLMPQSLLMKSGEDGPTNNVNYGYSENNLNDGNLI